MHRLRNGHTPDTPEVNKATLKPVYDFWHSSGQQHTFHHLPAWGSGWVPDSGCLSIVIALTPDLPGQTPAIGTAALRTRLRGPLSCPLRPTSRMGVAWPRGFEPPGLHTFGPQQHETRSSAIRGLAGLLHTNTDRTLWQILSASGPHWPKSWLNSAGRGLCLESLGQIRAAPQKRHFRNRMRESLHRSAEVLVQLMSDRLQERICLHPRSRMAVSAKSTRLIAGSIEYTPGQPHRARISARIGARDT